MSADRFRTFGDTFGKGAPVFLHLADTGITFTNADGQITTGAWRPATPADVGSVSNVSVSGLNLTVGAVAVTGNPLMTVSNVTPIPMSGAVYVQNQLPINVTGWVTTITTGNVSFDSSAIVNAQATGNNYLGFISGREINNNNFLSGISGRLNSIVPISGVVQSNITNAVVPISGVVQAAVSIGAVAVTGGSISISNGVVPISGVVQAQVSSGPIVDAQASGNALAVTANVLLSGISGALAGNLSDTALVRDVTGQLYLAAISGLLSSNLSDPAWVTGAVSIVGGGALNVAVTGGVISSSSSTVAVTGGVTINGGGSLNVAVTGGVISSSSSNPVGVTGTKMDNNVSIWGASSQPYAMLPIGGRAVMPSGAGSITGGYNTGDYVMFSFNAQNGGLMCNQGALDATQDNVTTVASGVSSVSSNTVSGINNIGWGTPLNANPNRLAWGITNLSTGTIFVAFRSSVNSGTAHIVLRGGSGHMDGGGQSYISDPTSWRGPVSVTGYFFTSPAYSAWEY